VLGCRWAHLFMLLLELRWWLRSHHGFLGQHNLRNDLRHFLFDFLHDLRTHHCVFLAAGHFHNTIEALLELADESVVHADSVLELLQDELVALECFLALFSLQLLLLLV